MLNRKREAVVLAVFSAAVATATLAGCSSTYQLISPQQAAAWAGSTGIATRAEAIEFLHAKYSFQYIDEIGAKWIDEEEGPGHNPTYTEVHWDKVAGVALHKSGGPLLMPETMVLYLADGTDVWMDNHSLLRKFDATGTAAALKVLCRNWQNEEQARRDTPPPPSPSDRPAGDAPGASE